METLLWRNATPEQLNLWNIAKAKIAYTTITPKFFMGAVAGSEFVTYDANHLYIALEIKFGIPPATGGAGIQTNVYDESNTLCMYFANDAILYNAADRFLGNSMELKNFYFGRIVSGYTYMMFNGYLLHT
jgi:hypothetical protein